MKSVTVPGIRVACFWCCLVAVSITATAQSTGRWLAHDMQRPRPPVIAPAKQLLPVLAPSDAVVLFDGTDLSKWRDAEGGPAKWKSQAGYMESVPNSGYIYSADKFGDVQLHVEWASPVPAKGRSQGRGNSGVFLMGLYEVQVLDSYENDTYPDGQAAAIYGQYPPLVNACLPPGQWQSYDIVFHRPRFHEDGTLAKPARLTVHHNGILVQDGRELWGPTAWLQSLPYKSHPDKLHLSLQDHGNPVRYRNIWLRELQESTEGGPPAEQRGKTVELTADQLQRFVGAYQGPLGEFGTIELKGDQLRLHMKMGQVIDLLPMSATEFAMRWTAGKLVFEVKDPGQVAGFTMHLGGEEYPIRRMPATQSTE
jgi:hypothetical protein